MGGALQDREATVSGGPEIPNQGTINYHYSLFYGYGVKVDISENEEPKPSCSHHNFYIPPKKIKAEAPVHSSAKTESGSSVSGMTEEIGNGTTEAKAKVSHHSSSEHTSKRKHEKSSSEAACEPGTSCQLGTFYDMPSKSSLVEDEIQVFNYQKADRFGESVF
ncbi:hypothetical protein STEG23_034789 [Scotinomys teguina]